MNRSESIETADGGSHRENLPPVEPGRPFQFSLRTLLSLVVVVSIALSCVVNLPAIAHWMYRRWQIGERFDQRTFHESQFAIRVTAFHERGTFMGGPGGYYRYEVNRASDWSWRQIIMFRLPTPTRIPSDQVQGVTDRCAYFFHEHVFGVTADGGASWTFRGGQDNPPISRGRPDPYARIDSVSISTEGTGVMDLSNVDYVRGGFLPSRTLLTSDFGLTWSEP